VSFVLAQFALGHLAVPRSVARRAVRQRRYIATGGIHLAAM